MLQAVRQQEGCIQSCAITPALKVTSRLLWPTPTHMVVNILALLTISNYSNTLQHSNSKANCLTSFTYHTRHLRKASKSKTG